MPLIDRIGMDSGTKHSVADGLRWAATHGLRYVDFRLDTGPEAFGAFTAERCAALRTRAEADGITMGLHTLSAVNIAEYAPYLAEAADHYLRAYIDIAKALHARSAMRKRKGCSCSSRISTGSLNTRKSIIWPITSRSVSTISTRLTPHTSGGPLPSITQPWSRKGLTASWISWG